MLSYRAFTPWSIKKCVGAHNFQGTVLLCQALPDVAQAVTCFQLVLALRYTSLTTTPATRALGIV
jgi:hypothetical protein